MARMTTRLLVYGLLRCGLSMNEMLEGAVSLGERRVAGFDLYDLSDYPGAAPGAGTLIAELYRLASAAQLEALDEAEGLHFDPPLYCRQAVRLEDGEAWLYVYARPLDGAPRIASGDWLDR